MRQFEYKKVKNFWISEPELQELGLAGWELCTYIQRADTYLFNPDIYLFKRELEPTTEKVVDKVK